MYRKCFFFMRLILPVLEICNNNQQNFSYARKYEQITDEQNYSQDLGQLQLDGLKKMNTNGC
jgi:hypothetical protein